MRAADLIVGRGDRVRLSGKVIAADDGEWLDPLADIEWVATAPSRSDRAVRLLGRKPHPLPAADSDDQFVAAGWVQVTGVWREDSIEVESSSFPRLRDRPRLWTVPPCPPPPGGWPHGKWRIPEIDRTHVTNTTLFTTDQNQRVLVLAASDVEAVAAAIDPTVRDRVCVVPSRFTKAQLDEAGAALREHRSDWAIGALMFDASDAQGQPYIRASVFRVIAELAEWVDRQPEGLVVVWPRLAPAEWVSPS